MPRTQGDSKNQYVRDRSAVGEPYHNVRAIATVVRHWNNLSRLQESGPVPVAVKAPTQIRRVSGNAVAVDNAGHTNNNAAHLASVCKWPNITG